MVGTILFLALVLIAMALRVVREYERGVHFRLGRIIGVKEPGLRIIWPIIGSTPFWP